MDRLQSPKPGPQSVSESHNKPATETSETIPASVSGSESMGATSLDIPDLGAQQRQQAVLTLQRTIGNRRTVQRLAALQREPSEIDSEPPIPVNSNDQRHALWEKRQQERYDAAVASPLQTADNLLVLVRRVEAAYPGDNWKGIVTRIRKSYYDGFLWNSMINDRESYPGLGWPPLALEDFKAFTEAKNHPEVLINGVSIDLGHVFTGLDAINFSNTGTLMSLAGVQGPAGATWSGDVGSALAEWDVDGRKNLGLTADPSQREAFYQKFASNDDMFGDVDGIAISKVSLPAGAADTLSTRLQAYYQSIGGAGAGSSQRFTKFCAASGFAWTGKGSGIQFDSNTQTLVNSQIENFAIQWRRKKVLGNPGGNWFHDEDIKWFSNRFLNWVIQGLAAENP
jgi:hypothetical protein